MYDKKNARFYILMTYIGVYMLLACKNYYTVETYNYTGLSMLSQLRIVAENQFNETAQSNSAVVDFFTNIKSLSLEASESNISRIWNISNSYSQIHCNPWYNGYSVEIEYR